MDPNLSTTNVLLAIMAAVSILEGLVVIGVFAGAVMIYRHVARTLASIETHHISPASSRVNAILDDIKAVTTIIRLAAEGVDTGARSGLTWLFDRLRSRPEQGTP